MDVLESLGERSAERAPEVPRFGLLGAEAGRSKRLELAFTVALLLHLVLILVVLFGGRFVRGGKIASAQVLVPRPTPVRVVFYPRSAAPRATPPPAVTEVSDESRRARSEAKPLQPSERRIPAARGTSDERVPESRKHRARAAGAPPAPPPPPPEPPPESSSAVARADIPSTLAEALRAAAESRRAARASAPQVPAGGAASGFGSEALDAAIQRQGFGNVASAVTETGPLDFDVKDFEWGPYARRLYEIVDRNWKSVIPLAARMPGVTGRCKVRFRISRNGRVSSIELLSSSGRLSLDQAAMASIELSNPLPPLPSDFPGEDVGVTFAYFYNLPIDDDAP